ncbi:MAG: protein kinase [Agarilytica sp.]
MSADESEIPGYTISKRLGRGGMATVHLAMQQPINRQVALKIMSNQLGEDSVWAKRFIQEAQVIAQLTHPNVVPVYDVGTHGGKFYISMEYLAGGSLKDKMSHGIVIPEVLKIVAGVAAGLDYAGEKGFVHRDIKPDNIMFRSDGSPVILDFGIVKQMDDAGGMTQTGVIVGTTSYMSPEQAQGRELDQRSDIYALGVMFFELLTGKPPYKGDTDVATLLMHVNDPIPNLPEKLAVFQPIINKALSKDPFHRYTRAREMIDHIQKLEPEIKATIQRLKVGNASDKTYVKNPKALSDGDETVVMTDGGGEYDTGTTQQITTEEELTKVLSSAKATINDFSVESRARRARRTKNLIRGMSLVAVCAIGYVGYQQLVLVPQERAAADAKIREAELKTQRKIASLLDEAKQARVGLLPTETDKVDNIIAIYRQVLTLDSENNEAEFTLEKFGERYIEMAKTAVRRRDINKAITYRDYAEQLVPTSSELPGLRNVIKSLRSEELDREFVREEVENLLAVAKADIDKSDGFSDSAYTKLQQVLRIDPDNRSAANLTNTMLEKLFNKAQKDIGRGRLSSAREAIEILEKYYEDPVRVAELNAELKYRSAGLAKKNQLAELEKQATRLQREKRSLGINDELRDIYLAIQKIDRLNKHAKTGLTETSDYDAKIARQAIDERDFARAQKQIDVIQRTTPRYAPLSSLKQALQSAKKSAQQSARHLAEAKKYLNTTKQGDAKRRDLAAAYASVEKARSVDEKNTEIGEILASLENMYVSEIKQLISRKDKKLLEAYKQDTRLKPWPTDRIFELYQLAQKTDKKPKRVITGGF